MRGPRSMTSSFPRRTRCEVHTAVTSRYFRRTHGIPRTCRVGTCRFPFPAFEGATTSLPLRRLALCRRRRRRRLWVSPELYSRDTRDPAPGKREFPRARTRDTCVPHRPDTCRAQRRRDDHGGSPMVTVTDHVDARIFSSFVAPHIVEYISSNKSDIYSEKERRGEGLTILLEIRERKPPSAALFPF